MSWLFNWSPINSSQDWGLLKGTQIQNANIIFHLVPSTKRHILQNEVKHINTSKAFYDCCKPIQFTKTLYGSYLQNMRSLTPLQVYFVEYVESSSVKNYSWKFEVASFSPTFMEVLRKSCESTSTLSSSSSVWPAAQHLYLLLLECNQKYLRSQRTAVPCQQHKYELGCFYQRASLYAAHSVYE